MEKKLMQLLLAQVQAEAETAYTDNNHADVSAMMARLRQAAEHMNTQVGLYNKAGLPNKDALHNMRNYATTIAAMALATVAVAAYRTGTDAG